MLRLSYSNYKTFKDCPLQYDFRLKRTPTPDENKVNALYGSIVGVLFEEFYLRELWKDPEPIVALTKVYPQVLKKVIRSFMRPGRSYISFKDPSSNYKSLATLDRSCRTAIARGVQSILDHGLTGEPTRAEMVLDVADPTNDVLLVGRADFVIVTERHGLVIVDGKGSRHHDKYLDPDQLYWYAYQYSLLYGILPSKLAFLHWRFEGDKSITWHIVDDEAMESFKERLSSVVRKIKANKFRASPSSSCKLCSYVPLCDSGRDYLEPVGVDPFLE